jgi:LPXTG-motif cell wall-anchored protein
MRRLVTLLIAASLLALPCSALAQSAGDEQYADPFGQVEKPNNGQGQQSEAPAQAAPAPAAPAQAAAPTTAADTAAASQETAGATLPRTGVDTVFFVVMGATLLLAGATIRRLAS